MNTRILAALALLGFGLVVMSGSKSAVKKTFVYRAIKVKLLNYDKKDEWYWQATPVKWPPKSFWEWIKWPLSGGFPQDVVNQPYPDSEAAALDALRVIDETVPYE